jgi:hypothetical protein
MKPSPPRQILSQKLCTLCKEEEVVAEGVKEDVETIGEKEDAEPLRCHGVALTIQIVSGWAVFVCRVRHEG